MNFTQCRSRKTKTNHIFAGNEASKISRQILLAYLNQSMWPVNLCCLLTIKYPKFMV